ncbi:MAG: hypothetical protein GY832_08750 [Chloroflexi bacterium]|nr:hypothetical protein [Chloroflexota bacterium]
MERVYPDISDILSAKLRQRRILAALSWEDKVAIVERMRMLLPKGQWKDRSVSDNKLGHIIREEL